jgi:imidazolonepropionase-like amidohydrolase
LDVKRAAIHITAIAVAATALFGSVRVATEPRSIAFIHATVVDATGSPGMLDATVVVSGDRIAAVGRDVRFPDGTEVIDSTGKFVIPGLWDMHVHLGSYEDGNRTLTRLAE